VAEVVIPSAFDGLAVVLCHVRQFAQRPGVEVVAGGDTHLNEDTLSGDIDHWLRTAKPEVRRFTRHDLRITVKSHLRALGVRRESSEMCVNHELSGVEGIYDRHTYLEERLVALGSWARLLDSLMPTHSEAG
jgi:hypothetical protein